MPMETKTVAKSAITLSDTANSQLQNTIFQHSLAYYLCIFSSNEQEPAFCTHKNLLKPRFAHRAVNYLGIYHPLCTLH